MEPAVTLERLWAGWRSDYVGSAAAASGGGGGGGPGDCVLCRILASEEPPDQTYLLWRDDTCAVVLNAFPYTSGHLMVFPVRHVAEVEDVGADEATALWAVLSDAVRALKAAYAPDGLNVGANVGRAAGAGVPGHFHVHCLPRWNGDTNFMTSVAEARVLPESLPATYERVGKAWPR
jgi:diadenosine tetraphosphate (Ap4A) HIT family hydrolase